MKIVLYDDDKVGLLNDGDVVDVSALVPTGATPQLTVEGLIAAGGPGRRARPLA